jgi:HlyD family secretion protein
VGASVFAVGVVLVVAWTSLSVRLHNTAVDASELVIGRVERTTMVRDVRAPGVLVPTELRWIAAGVDGRVEKILLQAGASVQADTLLLELSNPTVARDADTARIELQVLQAQDQVLEKRMLNEVLAQQAVVAEYESQYENARFRMQAYQSLGAAVSRVDLNEALLLAGQYEERLRIERERLVRLRELRVAELQASQAGLVRAQRQLQLQQELQDALMVRAGIEGTLQEVPVEPGQLLAAGTPLARVAREDNFKTELRIQEGQAREIRGGQKVLIAAGGQHTEGSVSRIDPAVQEGTVRVDVAFTGAPLPGARPDLRVQGVIEIDQVDDALVLPRPVFSQEHSSTLLFVLRADGSAADKRTVGLGMGSVDRIQVLEGLREGERVIVSDMSRYAEKDSIELTGVRHE